MRRGGFIYFSNVPDYTLRYLFRSLLLRTCHTVLKVPQNDMHRQQRLSCLGSGRNPSLLQALQQV